MLILSYNDKSTCLNDDDYELEMGDVFMYVADANGLVSKFIVIAEIGDNGDIDVIEDLDEEKLGKDTEIVKGYIYNEKSKKTNGKEIIFYNAEEETMAVLASSYKYTYDESGRKAEIVAGDFLENVEWYDEEEGVCPILFRVVDGKVVDVYASTAVQALAE